MVFTSILFFSILEELVWTRTVSTSAGKHCPANMGKSIVEARSWSAWRPRAGGWRFRKRWHTGETKVWSRWPRFEDDEVTQHTFLDLACSHFGRNPHTLLLLLFMLLLFLPRKRLLRNIETTKAIWHWRRWWNRKRWSSWKIWHWRWWSK